MSDGSGAIANMIGLTVKTSEIMTKITKEQYEYAQNRIEELLPIVDGNDLKDRNVIELSMLSDVVIEYEKEYYPIEKPSVHELIADALREKSMTQKQLSQQIGVSQSRISDYVSGRAVPTLKIAGQLCLALDIQPAAMLGL